MISFDELRRRARMLDYGERTDNDTFMAISENKVRVKFSGETYQWIVNNLDYLDYDQKRFTYDDCIVTLNTDDAVMHFNMAWRGSEKRISIPVKNQVK